MFLDEVGWWEIWEVWWGVAELEICVETPRAPLELKSWNFMYDFMLFPFESTVQRLEVFGRKVDLNGLRRSFDTFLDTNLDCLVFREDLDLLLEPELFLDLHSGVKAVKYRLMIFSLKPRLRTE